MTGLEFRPTSNMRYAGGPLEGPFAKDENPFKVVFRPILARLGEYWWAIEAPFSVFLVNEDDKYGAALARCPIDEYIPGYLLFPRLAGCVLNDWCAFFGVREPNKELPPAPFAERCAHDWPYARAHAGIGFYCIDGARWMIMARDESLLAVLTAHHATELAPRGIHLRQLTQPII